MAYSRRHWTDYGPFGFENNIQYTSASLYGKLTTVSLARTYLTPCDILDIDRCFRTKCSSTNSN